MTFRGEAMVMVARLFAPQFLVLYWFAITAMIVHFRGRDRLTLTRQLTDHSTLLAPIMC
jgi:beta-hydroxylase